jgi:hypothetical protein
LSVDSVPRAGQISDIVDWVIGLLVDWFSGYKYGFIPYLQNNWTLALRFQVSGVSSKKVRAGLTPDT